MTRRGRPLPPALAIAPEDAPPDIEPAGSLAEHRQRAEDREQEEAPRDGDPRVVARRGDPTCGGFGADGDACALVPDHAPPCAGIDQAVSTENLPEAPRDGGEPFDAAEYVAAMQTLREEEKAAEEGSAEEEAPRGAGHVRVVFRANELPDTMSADALAALVRERAGTPPSPASPPAQGTDAPASTEAAAPTAADLTAEVCKLTELVELRKDEEVTAHERVIVAAERLARAIDAKARSLGPGKLCSINGATLRATKPRKRKGQPEDPAALWTLEPVEVGE